MNYWIQTTEFPPFHGGGISTYCHHTSEMLLRKGHNVVVIVPDHQFEGDKYHIEKGRLTVVRFRPVAKEYYKVLGYTAALSFQFAELCIELLRGRDLPKPDYIETQEYLGIGYYTILKKKLGEPLLADLPIVLTAHAPSFFYLRSNQSATHALPDYWTGIMEKWTMKAADIRISPSHYLKNAVASDLGKQLPEINVIRNPYEFESVKDITNASYVPGEIVFLGKLTFQKGCQDLIRYLDRAWENGFKGCLRVIGDDHHFAPRGISMREYLEKRYTKHITADRIRFEGKITPKAIYERLVSAHLVVIPSVVDNLPYTVIESMSKGKLVLVSDTGGHAELIDHGVDGFIYQQGNEESFLSSLNQIMELAPREVVAIGKRARQKIQKLCNYESVYWQKMSLLRSFKEESTESNNFPFATDIEPFASRILEKGNELLSVVVPYFNMGQYVEETIKSIYAADYNHIEIIVVNDGSTDPESITTIFRLQEQYGFKLITQRNGGLADARNTGVKHAKGAFVTFLDPDDLIAPAFYKTAVAVLNRYHNLSFVSSWVEYFQESKGIWPAQNPEPPFLLIHNMVCAGIVVRKADFLQHGMNDVRFEYGMEDYDSVLSLVLNGCRGVVVPEPYYKYRIHHSSMARGFNKVNQLYLYSLLIDKHQNAYRQYAPDIFKLLMANGPGYLYDNPTIEPNTDVRALQHWIGELEKANKWYADTLKYINGSGEHLRAYAMAPSGGKITQHTNGFQTSHAAQIQEWYNKEYEVLPGWYKKFGHLIKVAQGHRSLKSLLNKRKK